MISITLPFECPEILAVGADLKSAVCLTKGNRAFLSHQMGNLEDTLVYNAFEETISALKKKLGTNPKTIAHDMHPDYFSTQFAKLYAQHTALRETLIPVQHHHAHIASCMAENNLPNEKVIGVALDGTGFGTDGTIWGGEILCANYDHFERLARFKPVAIPGGDYAAREPWRMAVSYISSLVTRDSSLENKKNQSFENTLLEIISRRLKSIDEKNVRLILQMIEKGINSPMTSSAGRLFDAVAAIIDKCIYNTFEGEAAILLENIADKNEENRYEFKIENRSNSLLLEINFSRMINEIIADLECSVPPPIISARFHNTIVEAIAQTCLSIKSFGVFEPRATSHERRICFSGGCFLNKILATRLKKRLEKENFAVYTHALVSTGDGGVALGQAAIATHTTGK